MVGATDHHKRNEFSRRNGIRIRSALRNKEPEKATGKTDNFQRVNFDDGETSRYKS